MCLIVDANRAGPVFGDPGAADSRPIFDWLSKRGGLVVYGGRLKDELVRLEAARRILLQLAAAGRAKDMDPAHRPEIEAEEQALAVMGTCRSNDPHVIALARVSGARVLCTDDSALMEDFKDRALVPGPRGKVYRRAIHAKVLSHSAGCQKPPARGRGKRR